MKYILQPFEQEMRIGLRTMYPSGEKSLGAALHYAATNAVYNDFELFAMWQLWYMWERRTDYALYDAINEAFPEVKNSHIETLLRNAIKAEYGKTLTRIMADYLNDKG